MDGFIATHPSGKEEWIISRHGRRFRKAETKETPAAVVYHNTIKTYFNVIKALDAFHAEKRKAKAKGMAITDFDSSTRSEAPRPKIKALIARRVRFARVFGQKVPLEDL